MYNDYRQLCHLPTMWACATNSIHLGGFTLQKERDYLQRLTLYAASPLPSDISGSDDRWTVTIRGSENKRFLRETLESADDEEVNEKVSFCGYPNSLAPV